ncbi:glycoside hydrolase family 25 [Brucella melitensis]
MLQPQPSAETTSSIVRPVPPAPVHELASAPEVSVPQPREEILAWAGPIPDAIPNGCPQGQK